MTRQAVLLLVAFLAIIGGATIASAGWSPLAWALGVLLIVLGCALARMVEQETS